MLPPADGNAGRVPNAMQIVTDPSLTDKQKFEAMGLGDPDNPKARGGDTVHADPGNIFDKRDIDPVTGGLLGLYVAEERDSARILGARVRPTAWPSDRS